MSLPPLLPPGGVAVAGGTGALGAGVVGTSLGPVGPLGPLGPVTPVGPLGPEGVEGLRAAGGIAVAEGTVSVFELAALASSFCLSFVRAPTANPTPTPIARIAAMPSAIQVLVPGARRYERVRSSPLRRHTCWPSVVAAPQLGQGGGAPGGGRVAVG